LPQFHPERAQRVEGSDVTLIILKLQAEGSHKIMLLS